jgi:metal-sulfur cluster biosynthetic enzyme
VSVAEDRRSAVEELLNGILDPCGLAANAALGLLDMGIVASLAIRDDGVWICLLPTFPGCLFIGVFEEEIKRRLKELAWCREVDVTLAPANVEWDESRMSEAGRARLRGVRSRRQSPRQSPRRDS